MRKCLYNAGLTDCKPEAAAIYSSFMIVDCGGGTVDLTTRRLLRDNKLSERMEIFVLGESTINLLRENNYGQMQYMIQQFCQKLKFHFTGNQNEFDPFEFDIE
ncbi:hypothetical protein RhiirA5_414678 [Rhizophagus irregularis]|uniref:Actin-like ATPase domain-containing protein n=1 Tax=Rhizophagus irregularis TaxID=588596 RepID=A0A2N0PTL8_9GLOM|nr:hypothetical protein RhiirA5_414678 [Rhizophagus irregularis]